MIRHSWVLISTWERALKAGLEKALKAKLGEDLEAGLGEDLEAGLGEALEAELREALDVRFEKLWSLVKQLDDWTRAWKRFGGSDERLKDIQQILTRLYISLPPKNLFLKFPPISQNHNSLLSNPAQQFISKLSQSDES
jgi:hypothetical protein